TQFYGGAGNSINGKVVAGAQDNGTQVYSGDPQSWNAMFGGDGGFAAADPGDANYFYGEYVYMRIHRSNTGGQSSSYIYSGITEATSSNANFIAPFILDPNNPNTMYGGANHLWRSTNVKASTPSWNQVPNLPIPSSTCASSPNSCITSVAVAKGNPDVIWVGRNNGLIYYTTNGTALSPSWTQVDANLPGGSPNRAVNRITIDPQNSSVVYVSLGGFTSGNLLKTTNNGAAGSWTDVTGTGSNKLPQVPIYSMAVHPYASGWLYVGTTIGLFASEDGGQNWQVTPGDGPTNAPVNELSWLGNSTTLLAVTHGRGIFKADIPSTVPILNATASSVTESGGTGNGILDPGETAKVQITLKNSGSVTASAISSTLTVGSGPAIIVQGSSAYADIAPNSTGVNSTDYLVQINSNAQCGDRVTLHQTVNYVGGRVTTYDITFVIGSASLGANQHYAYSGGGVTVPDNNPTGADVPVTVNTSGKVGKIKVTLSATMTFDGDLTFSLISPTGQSVTLIAQRGGGGANFVNTVLDDSASSLIGNGTAPFTGSYQPEQALSSLMDVSLNGTWKLHIVDSGPGDVATITDFQLDIQPNVYSCGCSLNVTSTGDDTSCGTLRRALQDAALGSGQQTITFAPSLGPIMITATLPAVPAGVTLQGSCSNSGPAVVISGPGVTGPGLTLSGNDTLNGIKVVGFNGPQIKAGPPGGGANHFSCVVASKGS
ncbi:MAG TPA: proprotein convertase P-domain-containing protein, partial [Chloroflexia bacterium]|nr:proprotein convertase P-domain-containing protein [Chloroflexia bacterium]